MDSSPLSSSVWVSLGFQSRYSLTKMSGDTAGNCTEYQVGGHRRLSKGCTVMGQGNKGVRVSSVPLGHQVKRRTSSLFCGCGGIASRRRPCPGAGEKEWDGELAYVDICSVSLWHPTDVDAFGCAECLRNNISCRAAQTPQMAIKGKPSNLCDGDRHRLRKH